MPGLKTASLYVKTTDDLPGNFHEVQLNMGFGTPIVTSMTFGLVEEIEYLAESIGKFVLSFNIDDEEYFISLNPQNQACLATTGGTGPLHKAFLLMESIDTALALTREIPKPQGNVSSYTIYKLSEFENDDLIFDAVFKNDYIKSYS